MAVLLFFIDGLGLGQRKKNPLIRFRLWKHLLGSSTLISQKKILKRHFCMVPVDPCLGVPGVPQSATGQTALLTGINAPELIGGHVTGFPGEVLSKVILEHSLLKSLKKQGIQVTSANAYSQDYFQRVALKHRRVSATTLAIQAADIPFRLEKDLASGQAVLMDLTRHFLKNRYPEISEIFPGQAAVALKTVMDQNQFVLFEYFLTDYYGHRGSFSDQKKIIRHLNSFLKKLLKKLDLNKNTVVIASDHGNIEDSSHKRHTCAKVPVLVFSKKRGFYDIFFPGFRS